MSPCSVLVIEDNEDILANIYEYLEPLGYNLDCARNGLSGLKMAISGAFDCVLLDIKLPGLDGINLCRKLREVSSLPVIMLTALDTEKDLVAGLDSGADDYMVKPFSLRELEARIRAVMRRGSLPQPPGVFSIGDLQLDTGARMATRQKIPLKLSPTSYRILMELARSSPNTVTREELENLLWGGSPPCESALRTHIHELRQILDKPFASPLLHTVPHVGYRLAHLQNK